MAIQLKQAPNIKITMRNGELFSDYAPNYIFQEFELTKNLLEPNCFEFTVRKDDLSLEDSDFKFNLRDELLGAKVEVSLVAQRYDEEQEEYVFDEVEKFFYGYIQNIKILRESVRKPLTFKCTAYSPDSRLKLFPSCRTFNEYTLEDCVEDILGIDASEETTPFANGEYDDFEGLSMEVHPRFQQEMPYTVQYNESAYNFLKRLARRYGEFFYYEDGDVVFGDMVEKELISLQMGLDLEQFSFDLNMNHHTGIMFAQHNQDMDAYYFTNMEKYPEENTGDSLRESPVDPTHEMTRSAYEASTEFFNDSYNSVIELRSAPELDPVVSLAKPNQPTAAYLKELYKNDLRDEQAAAKFMEEHNWQEKTFASIKRDLLDLYVAADSMICTGVARRADLKLGTILSLIDTTATGSDKEDAYEYDSLKVIGLYYKWEKDHTLKMTNKFKAIPHDSPVPPYLERDERGFLVYGDFDEYPKSGPQHGVVIDNRDPEHMGRVKVSLLWQNAVGRSVEGEYYFKYSEKKQCTPWIWLTSHYMGTFHGTHFVPERGDQVIVGFMHNNAERPYVMGSIGSRFNIAEDAGNVEHDTNDTKGFRTRSGHTIQFFDPLDEKGKVKIYNVANDTSAKGDLVYYIELNVADKLVRIKSKGNIEFDAGRNIVLHAGKNIVMTADNNMEIEVKNNMTTKVGNDMKLNVSHDRNVNVTAKDRLETRERMVVINDKEEHKFLNHFKCYDVGDTSSIYIGSDADVGGNPIILRSHSNRITINKPHIGLGSDKWINLEVTDMFTSCLSMKEDNVQLRFKQEEIKLEQGRLTVKSSQKLDLRGGVAVGINGKIVKVN